MQSVWFSRYNIVGDGTPQALIPILTGKTELELPDTRKRLSNTNFVNVYPFIWNDFKDIGYVTGYFEDEPNTGIFTYRLKGFDVNFLPLICVSLLIHFLISRDNLPIITCDLITYQRIKR